MILLIMSGLFPYVAKLMYLPASCLSTHMYLLNFSFPFSPSKLTTEKNSIIKHYVLTLLLTA